MKRDTRFLTMAVRNFTDSFLVRNISNDIQKLNAIAVSDMATNVIIRNLTVDERNLILSSRDFYTVSSVILPYLDIFLESEVLN